MMTSQPETWLADILESILQYRHFLSEEQANMDHCRWAMQALMVTAVSTVATGEILLVPLGVNGSVSFQQQFAAQVCSGLYNRPSSHPANTSYMLMNEEDASWLADVEGITNPLDRAISVEAFLVGCLSPGGPAAGYIRYNATDMKAVLPVLSTVAGVRWGQAYSLLSVHLGGSRMPPTRCIVCHVRCCIVCLVLCVLCEVNLISRASSVSIQCVSRPQLHWQGS
jgi:hypothetical protein